MTKESDELGPLGSTIALISVLILVAWTLYKDSILTFWNQYWLVIIGLVILVIFIIIAYLSESLSIGVAGVIIFSILTIWGIFGENIITLWIQNKWVILGLGIPLCIGIFIILSKILSKISENQRIEDELFEKKYNKEQDLHKSIIRKKILKEKGAQLEDLTDEEKEYQLDIWVDEEFYNELLGKSSNGPPGKSSNNQLVKESKIETEKVRPLSSSIREKYIKEVGTRCCYPNCDERYSLEVHHIIRRSEGGSNKENNLIVLCNNCHDKAWGGLIPKQRLKHHSVAKEKQNKRI